jgi:hypothetical protein
MFLYGYIGKEGREWWGWRGLGDFFMHHFIDHAGGKKHQPIGVMILEAGV